MGNGPFKMKGSPFARNFGISPVKQDYTKQDYTKQDTTRAIGVRKAEFDNTNYRPTVSEIDSGNNWKNLLKETDKKTNDEIDTYNVLKRGYKNNVKKKRLKDLNKKAVKGTKENTYGVLRNN